MEIRALFGPVGSTFSCFFAYLLPYAGRPNSSGLKSSMELRTWVACLVISGSIRESGIMTTCIPAARAAVTPFGASSNTKH